MPTYLAPGIYVEERSSGVKPIEGASTSVAAFVGVAVQGPVGRATLVTSFSDFVKRFGGPLAIVPAVQEHYLYYAVRHFFAQGGTRCYVVRVVAYGDVDNAATIVARSAFTDIGGALVDGTPVTPALRVSALNEGRWGERIEVRTEASSRFSLLLAADVAAGSSDRVFLVESTDVRIGSQLHLVQEVSGIVAGVDPATRVVTFQTGLTSGGADFAGNIAVSMDVLSPELDLVTVTDQAAPVAVAAGVAPTGIRLARVTKADGTPLRSGDVLNFVAAEALVVVESIAGATVGGQSVTEVRFTAQALPALPRASTRVYARDFTLSVRLGGDEVERHENLTLVASQLSDHVERRLGPDSGGSLYVTVSDSTTNEAVVVGHTAYVGLTGGDDGLTGLTDAAFIGSDLLKTGLRALDPIDDVSILALPGASAALSVAAIAYCEGRRDLFYVVDPPRGSDVQAVIDFRNQQIASSTYAALYYPWIEVDDVLSGRRVAVPPSGAVAGVYASTDVKRGVHKAPAGIDSGRLTVARGLERIVTRGENDTLYPHEVNVIRNLPEGIAVWGSRTLSADPEWVQVNVRRLFLFLEKSIERGTGWVVFEPNDPTLWKSIERNVRAFLKIQWLEGKLVGDSEEQAFFVKCNAETNPPEVVDAGQVITEIGVAPSRPAEFVIFRIRQFAGQAAA